MSKAAEILKALNSQIQHPLGAIIQEKLPQSETKIKIDTNKSSKQLKTIDSGKNILKQKPQQKKELPPQELTQMLLKHRQKGSKIYRDAFHNVESFVRYREKNIYDCFTKQKDEYLNDLFSDLKKKPHAYIEDVTSLITNRIGKVQEDISQGDLAIQNGRNLNNKKQLQKLQKLDRAKMIKIKDGELRSKMDILHHKISVLGNMQSWDLQEDQKAQQQIQKKLLENMSSNNYSFDAQKTKIAKDYVKYMQHQRFLFEKRKKQRQLKYDQQEAQRQAELKQAQQMKDYKKHQQILQKIETRKKKRQQQQRQYQIQEQKIKKFLGEYHKKLPIFKVKQKQFIQKFVKPQQKYREEKLNQIRDDRRSLSLNQIKKHEIDYIKKLRQENIKRKQQFRMIIKARSSEDKKKEYYKGQAHARIKQMTEEDILRNYSLREASKLKAHRMKEYGQVVHRKHKPAIDEDKKKQLIKFIQDDMMKKKHVKKLFRQIVNETTNEVSFEPYYQQLPPKDLYKEGNRLFQEAKKNIKKKQLGEEQKIQSPKSGSRVRMKLLQNRQDSQKKQLNVWEIRSKQLEEIANSDIPNAKIFEHVKKNIENLDGKAAQKQYLLKKSELKLDEHINQKGMLDHYYLKSIRQKMKLLE